MQKDDLTRNPRRDTIAAVATPAGRGGIGIVRVSGPRVPQVAQALIGGLPRPRLAALRSFCDARGRQLDRGIALYFPAPHSYTGEPVLELHGHGGPTVLQSVLAACLGAGARMARPGEFTERAFLEGKLDLVQAEAVADLIDAASREAAQSALRSLSGEFSEAIGDVVSALIELRALTEAMLDFPEEDLETLHRQDVAARLAAIRDALSSLLGRSRQGRLLGDGIHVAIAGRPNVGKSSLLNRLAGEDRAIVASVPGTTRDAVREPIVLEGVPLLLVDTAGLRASQDEIERLGMERTRREMAQANLVLIVHVAGERLEPLPGIPPTAARIDVFNKIDLAPGFVPGSTGSRTVAVSAKTGMGMDELRAAILEVAGWRATGETSFLARERHLRALERASGHLLAASAASLAWEFLAEELRLAQLALGEITGQVTADELLGRIFARFCIGK